jgi:integrase
MLDVDSIRGLLFKDFIRGNVSVQRLVMRVFRRSESINTVNTYVQAIKLFTEFTSYPNADKLIGSRVDWEAYLNDFIDYLLYNRKTSRATINLYIAGVKKWLKINGVKVDYDRVEVPQTWIVERDRIPTKTELQTLFKYGDLIDRVVLLLGVSTGLRRGTLVKLRVGDVSLDDDIPVLRVRPEASKDRPTRGYITFMTPECKEYLLSYLDWRRKNGEEITDESPLIGMQTLGRFLKPSALTQRWQRLLETASLNERSRKWRLLRFHTLRKYFKTWATLSGVPSDIVEAFMGHISGIKHVYFLAGVDSMENREVIEILRKEYSKAIPHLTINTSEELVRQLEEELEELKNRQQQYEEKINRLYKILDEVLQLVKQTKRQF